MKLRNIREIRLRIAWTAKNYSAMYDTAAEALEDARNEIEYMIESRKKGYKVVLRNASSSESVNFTGRRFYLVDMM